jgi:hypothetical protein
MAERHQTLFLGEGNFEPPLWNKVKRLGIHFSALVAELRRHAYDCLHTISELGHSYRAQSGILLRELKNPQRRLLFVCIEEEGICYPLESCTLSSASYDQQC